MSKQIHIHLHRIPKKVKDSVASVEKEIAQQQRLIDAAKANGKEAPGTVVQRLKFLKEELAKEKSKTEDAEPLYSESNPATVAHIKSLADRVKSTASQGFSKKGAAKAARALTDAVDALLYERD